MFNFITEKILSFLKRVNIPIFLILIFLPLRLINLGYSEYICDETFALDYLRKNDSFYSSEFLLSQHKGPIQYIVGGITYMVLGTVFNEYIYRLPFALVNVLSIVVFYLFVKNVFKNRFIAFTSAFLLGVNGYILAFGRIFQYQSFNLLFSFLSLYFFSKIQYQNVKDSNKSLYINSVTGTFFFCLSLLSHWDAVFVLPYIFYVLINDFFIKKAYSRETKTRFILFNLLILSTLVIFYFIPYVKNYVLSIENQAYFRNRINPDFVDITKYIKRVKFIFFRLKLYNPFLSVGVYLLALLSSFLFMRKAWLYVLWFLVEFLIFTSIFINPGTHIYNMFIPLTILAGISCDYFIKRLSNRVGIKKIFIFSLSFLLIFYYYQSYILFVDHKKEYPWKEKNVLLFKAGIFTEEEKSKYMLNNKIGFPLRREWEKVAVILNDYEITNNLPLGSMSVETNENECPVNFYLDRTVDRSNSRFLVAIKNPLSLVNDYKGFASRVKDKEFLSNVKGRFGDILAHIYVAN